MGRRAGTAAPGRSGPPAHREGAPNRPRPAMLQDDITPRCAVAHPLAGNCWHGPTSSPTWRSGSHMAWKARRSSGRRSNTGCSEAATSFTAVRNSGWSAEVCRRERDGGPGAECGMWAQRARSNDCAGGCRLGLHGCRRPRPACRACPTHPGRGAAPLAAPRAGPRGGCPPGKEWARRRPACAALRSGGGGSGQRTDWAGLASRASSGLACAACGLPSALRRLAGGLRQLGHLAILSVCSC